MHPLDSFSLEPYTPLSLSFLHPYLPFPYSFPPSLPPPITLPPSPFLTRSLPLSLPLPLSPSLSYFYVVFKFLHNSFSLFHFFLQWPVTFMQPPMQLFNLFPLLLCLFVPLPCLLVIL